MVINKGNILSVGGRTKFWERGEVSQFNKAPTKIAPRVKVKAGR